MKNMMSSRGSLVEMKACKYRLPRQKLKLFSCTLVSALVAEQECPFYFEHRGGSHAAHERRAQGLPRKATDALRVLLNALVRQFTYSLGTILNLDNNFRVDRL